MSHVKEILQRTPPPVLYHYTTQQGLLGIINDREIWATHTQYLNDVREFWHALEFVEKELFAMVSETGDDRSHEHLARMKLTLTLSPNKQSINVCVCSFSPRGDVLSQWRAYGGASGFAIGFSGEFLREMSNEYGWLVPVLYDEDEQRVLVRKLIEDVVDENIKRDKNPSPEDRYLAVTGNFDAYLYRYAPILKHNSFTEESEWRIVTRPLAGANERFGYRTGTSMLVPYFRLPLGGREDLGIREIVIGPTPHPHQSKESLRGLLTKSRIPIEGRSTPHGVNIRLSEVPYRNW